MWIQEGFSEEQDKSVSPLTEVIVWASREEQTAVKPSVVLQCEADTVRALESSSHGGGFLQGLMAEPSSDRQLPE